MSVFAPTGSNWQMVGAVYADFAKEGHIEMDEGQGVLVNSPQDDARENIHTKWEHGDLELELDVLMPKGSNSGIYFQGRYEVQLLDSWNIAVPAHKDMGGIYQQWDETKPDGEKGFGGIPPRINAARSPGLWQHFHIFFRAPRFDDNGNKIRDARFDYVYLNGVLLHEKISVSGPTRAHQLDGEAALGPLFFQGDHGSVAFRNIRYKTYGIDTLSLSNLQYRSYTGRWDHLPKFDSLKPFKEGTSDYIDIQNASETPNDFGVTFSGDLNIPTTGRYLFELEADDRAALIIDTQMVALDNEKGGNKVVGLADLMAGKLPFKLRYQQERGRSGLHLRYEGPEISWRSLAKPPAEETVRKQQDPIWIEVGEQPEMVRGFVMHADEKLTHTISVGTPQGIHFSYNLNQGALVKAWKGGFANVTNMWQGRGASQLLLPLNAAIQAPNLSSIAVIDEGTNWPDSAKHLQYLGYDLGEDQMPIFRFRMDEMRMSDRMLISEGKLKRQISVEGEGSTDVQLLLASALAIIQQPNGLFNINGQYFIDTEMDAFIQNFADHSELRVNFSSDLASYELIW
ncbi:MAG: DUF1080 domain-containing protein [Saprospiraceae bacterium]|nr:DUF1080 domain-containing protein [Saprospiraceae bacterium]